MAILPVPLPEPAAPAAPSEVLPPPPGSPTPVDVPAPESSSVATLANPVDEELPKPSATGSVPRRTGGTPQTSTVATDGLSRREASLRGKEGSRRRQRWENDRLLSNPHAIPPSAADWEPRPLYPQRVVPYQYASLWDHPSFRRRTEQQKKQECEKVPRELKTRLKKAHGAISLLKSLEEEVRDFLLGKEPEKEYHDDGVVVDAASDDEGVKMEEPDSEEEIVFVSKKVQMQKKKRKEEREKEKMMFESLLEDQSATFGRWLVHSIAKYYGLQSWSITTGNPAKRIAYIGLKNEEKKKKSYENSLTRRIPKPLYLMF